MSSGTTPETCRGCHFVWDEVDPTTVTARVDAAVTGFADALRSPHASTRPREGRWSTVEYGAHLRDVLLSIRDRVILAAVEECPSPPPIYRDHRVALGLYDADGPDVVAGDLAVAARLFRTAFDAIAPSGGDRPLIYSQQLGERRTINWTGAQAVHECEHHLADVRENERDLAG